jgi:hypothetical protein
LQFYNNDGALRIGLTYGAGTLYDEPKIFLINNVMFGNKSGIFGGQNQAVSDGRVPVAAYNNVIVGGESGVNQWMDDPSLNAEKATYNNIVETTANYPLSRTALSTTLSTDAFIPHLKITSATSTLVDAGLDNSTAAIGRDIIPAKDVRGGATRDSKDIGAYEWDAIVSSLRSLWTDQSKGFDVVQTTDGLEVRNTLGSEALLTVYDLSGRKLYSSTVQQSHVISNGELAKGIAVFTLSKGAERLVKKVAVY